MKHLSGVSQVHSKVPVNKNIYVSYIAKQYSQMNTCMIT